MRATAELYEMLRQWEGTRGSMAEAGELHRAVREAVMDEMVWLIRYGDPYLQVRYRAGPVVPYRCCVLMYGIAVL